VTLEIITHDLLGSVRHGFFTRKGGASSGVFSGLNCGAGSTDQRDIVTINRDRVARAMGVPPDHLVGVHQCHSAEAVAFDAPPSIPIRADAIVTTAPGLALTVLTADCQPVLMTAPGVVAAVHAGWRGTQAGVLEAAVAAMERAGARRGDIRAVIGPTISQRNYEVGPDLFDAITLDEPEADRFFAGGPGDRMLFDLPGYGLHRLRAAGIGDAFWTGHCTYADQERFFSYRRATHRKEADYGRLISAIRL
jgi:YfiH family protein